MRPFFKLGLGLAALFCSSSYPQGSPPADVPNHCCVQWKRILNPFCDPSCLPAPITCSGGSIVQYAMIDATCNPLMDKTCKRVWITLTNPTGTCTETAAGCQQPNDKRCQFTHDGGAVDEPVMACKAGSDRCADE